MKNGIIFFLVMVFLIGDVYAACCGTVKRTVTARKVVSSCGGPNCLSSGGVVRIRRSSSKNKKKNTVFRRREKKDYFENTSTATNNMRSAAQNEKSRRLEKLEKVHKLQEKLLAERASLTENELQELTQKIVAFSRPLRAMLGQVKDYPYFSEVTTLDKVASSLVGKKSAYSEEGMSALDILRKIQKKQYDAFEAFLAGY